MSILTKTNNWLLIKTFMIIIKNTNLIENRLRLHSMTIINFRNYHYEFT